MTPDLALVDGAIAFEIDLRVYRLAAVKKAGYRVADRCTAILDAPDGERVRVVLRFGPTVSEQAARENARRFFEELLDQELREHVADETSALRALIMAQAFSNVDLIKRS